MPDWFRLRLSHFHDSFVRPLYAWGVVGGGAAFIQGAAFLRDNFASAELQERWKAINLLPHWTWQGWAIVWLLVLLCVLFEGSYRRYRKLEVEYIEIKHRLQKIAQRRDLTYQNCNFQISQATSTSDITLNGVAVYLENVGEDLISYQIPNFFLERNGFRTALLTTGPAAEGFVHSRQTMSHSFNCPVPFSVGTIPATFRVGFSISYDNVPPVGARVTERTIEFTMSSLKPVVISNRIVAQEER
jgi:hypothetical protein